jgi:SAM-dependent methyltransferase
LLNGKLLDFGCGRKPYQNLFSVSDYIGVDMEQTGHNHINSMVDVFYDGKHIPFPDHSFDSVFCSEVLEHIFNPDEILTELSRVTKPQGRMLITVPFCWNEHEIPYDYARYSTFGITHLLQKHDFKIIECKKSGNFVQVLFQLWALYFFELFKKLGKTGYILSMILIAPVNLVGSIILLIMPKNDSMYFNTIILAEKTGKKTV